MKIFVNKHSPPKQEQTRWVRTPKETAQVILFPAKKKQKFNKNYLKKTNEKNSP